MSALLEGFDPELRHECVVIGVHYDHLGVRNGIVFHGADDNASGVAMMLEVARQLASTGRPRRSVMFVGFDLEEQMLWGSRWFAHPPRPLTQFKLFITADMIGRSLGDLPLPAVFILGSEHAPQLRTRSTRWGSRKDWKRPGWESIWWARAATTVHSAIVKCHFCSSRPASIPTITRHVILPPAWTSIRRPAFPAWCCRWCVMSRTPTRRPCGRMRPWPTWKSREPWNGLPRCYWLRKRTSRSRMCSGSL